LEKNGIPVIVDSPNVGKNLFNHTFLSVDAILPDNRKEELVNEDKQALFLGGAFLPDPRVKNKSQVRELELIFSANETGNVSIYILPLNPMSSGEIVLIDKQPHITFRYLENPRDMEIAKAAIRECVNIFKDMKLTVSNPSQDVLDNDKLLEQWLLQNVGQNHHWTSSCRMGTSIEKGVVNSTGKVYGTKNLYVVDDSIYPVSNDGNTSMPAYLVGRIIGHKLLES
jgi:choline dehydrogenase